MYVSDNGGSTTWVNHYHLEHYTTSRREDEGVHVQKDIDTKLCGKAEPSWSPENKG